MDKDKEIKRLKSLKQYANLSEEELIKIVDKKLIAKELTSSFIGLKDNEIEKAIGLYNKYVEESSFESLAEKSSLKNLVYLEILKERVQQFIKTEGDEKQGAIPLAMTEKLLFLDAQIMKNKETLGLLKEKDNDSFLKVWDELKKKAINYYNEHAGETYVKCPECQKLFRLLMKIDNLEVVKATFFKGTTLYNERVLQLYHEKKITLEDAAEILGVHTKYIIYIYENLYLKEKNDTQN